VRDERVRQSVGGQASERSRRKEGGSMPERGSPPQ
jgi:hypothetical protein